MLVIFEMVGSRHIRYFVYVVKIRHVPPKKFCLCSDFEFASSAYFLAVVHTYVEHLVVRIVSGKVVGCKPSVAVGNGIEYRAGAVLVGQFVIYVHFEVLVVGIIAAEVEAVRYRAVFRCAYRIAVTVEIIVQALAVFGYYLLGYLFRPFRTLVRQAEGNRIDDSVSLSLLFGR